MADPRDPLEMATNCARSIHAIAEAQEADPVMAHVKGLGDVGLSTARLAGNLALVSIARDLRRIVDHLTARDLRGQEPTL